MWQVLLHQPTYWIAYRGNPTLHKRPRHHEKRALIRRSHPQSHSRARPHWFHTLRPRRNHVPSRLTIRQR